MVSSLERDGFRMTQKVFAAPPDTTNLDPLTKRNMAICNLFAHHELPIRDIVRMLDEKYGNVVNVLIGEGLVYERRKNRQEPVKAERRQSYFRDL